MDSTLLTTVKSSTAAPQVVDFSQIWSNFELSKKIKNLYRVMGGGGKYPYTKFVKMGSCVCDEEQWTEVVPKTTILGSRYLDIDFWTFFILRISETVIVPLNKK